MAYDPQKAHEYYMRTRELKGRESKGVAKTSKGIRASFDGQVKKTTPKKPKDRASEKAKLIRLTQKVTSIKKALKEAHDLLSEKKQSTQKSRQTQKQTDRENSDGKSSAQERLESKKYRDKTKNQKATSDSSEQRTKPADMSVEQLEGRIDKLNDTLKNAKSQLKAANAALKNSGTTSASSFGVGKRR